MLLYLLYLFILCPSIHRIFHTFQLVYQQLEFNIYSSFSFEIKFTYNKMDRQTISPSEVLLCFFPVSSNDSGNNCAFLLTINQLPVLDSHINGIMPAYVLCLRLLSFSMMFQIYLLLVSVATITNFILQQVKAQFQGFKTHIYSLTLLEVRSLNQALKA